MFLSLATPAPENLSEVHNNDVSRGHKGPSGGLLICKGIKFRMLFVRFGEMVLSLATVIPYSDAMGCSFFLDCVASNVSIFGVNWIFIKQQLENTTPLLVPFGPQQAPENLK